MSDGRLWIILAAALLLRLGLYASVWAEPDRALTSDSKGYYALSEGLLRGEFTQEPDGQPEIFRTPGYPAFLLVGDLGQAWQGDRAELAVRTAVFVQVLLDVVLVGATFALASHLASRRAALWAAGLLAVSPVSIAAANRLLSDSLFALLLTAAILLLARGFGRDRRWQWLAAAGAAMAAACYVRPVGLAFLAIMAVVLIAGRRVWRRGLLLVGVALLLVMPWVVRNHVVADYRGFSSFATDSMYRFSAPQVLARAEGKPERWTARDFERAEANHRMTHWPASPGQMARFRARESLQVAAEHPGTWLALHLRGSANTLLPGATDVLEVAGLTQPERGTIAVLRQQGLGAAVRHYFGDEGWAIWLAAPMVAAWALIWLGVLLAGVLGLLRRANIGRIGWAMLLITAAGLLLPGVAGHPRFRVAVQPMLCIAAGWGISAAWAAFRSRGGGRATAASSD
jgi:4-amino-4-deoxy-L-arabinose transferase-like glycosyltransferase